ncbi:MAG: hypothetical protein K8S54_08665 [Spirochaetia bacterium]|nr:hypothetical protein [Spirochaetia bacterium]
MKIWRFLILSTVVQTAFCSAYTPMLRYQESIDPESSVAYGRFEALVSSGTTCALHLKGIGANAEDAYFPASTLGYGLVKLKPGKYRIVTVAIASGFQETLLPFGQPGEFLSAPFQIGAGEGVYLGDHACMNVRTDNSRTSRGQIKVEFRFQTTGYRMDATTNRVIELYGQNLNGKVLRSLEVTK